MTINTPNPDGDDPIVKDVVQGGGVAFQLPGFRYIVRGTVRAINEETDAVYVESPGVKQWVHKNTIIDAFSVDDQRSQAVVDTDASLLLQEAAQNLRKEEE